MRVFDKKICSEKKYQVSYIECINGDCPNNSAQILNNLIHSAPKYVQRRSIKILCIKKLQRIITTRKANQSNAIGQLELVKMH